MARITGLGVIIVLWAKWLMSAPSLMVLPLLASGGSTNHSMHFVAIARAAGIVINWDDISELSAVVPLLAKVYPNGQADINHFHLAGGKRLPV